MFEQLYCRPTVITRHRDAPYAEERARYLKHCVSNSRSKRMKGWCLAIVSSAFYTTKAHPQRASAGRFVVFE
jgi:hypothetical protein